MQRIGRLSPPRPRIDTPEHVVKVEWVSIEPVVCLATDQLEIVSTVDIPLWASWQPIRPQANLNI